MHKKGMTFGLYLLTLGGIGRLPWRPALLASAASTIALLVLEFVLPQNDSLRIGVLVGIGLFVGCGSLLALRRDVPAHDVDQSYVVVDEFLGILVALAPQLVDDRVRVLPALLAFGLFRIIDSIKPLGIRRIDAINAPVAVLLDDVVAGFYTALVIAGLSAAFQASAMLAGS
jgi:phosphatidylglycerophosphatase A